MHQVCNVELFLVAVRELDFPEAVRAVVLVARRKALDGAAVRLVSAGGGDENLGYDPPNRHLGVALDLRDQEKHSSVSSELMYKTCTFTATVLIIVARVFESLRATHLLRQRKTETSSSSWPAPTACRSSSFAKLFESRRPFARQQS